MRAPEAPKPFREQSRARRIAGGLILPALAGAIAGVLVGVSAGAYWGWAILAEAGVFVAGSEHEDGWEGADRGMIAGAIYGLFLLLTHWVAGNHPRASLGSIPELLIVVTAIAGALGGAAGGALARTEREPANGPPTPGSDISP